MPFSFTFKLTVPGLSNPFSSPAPSQSAAEPPERHARNRTSACQDIPRRRRRPSPTPVAPLSRKRGWEPSYPESSQSVTNFASSSSHLGRPAKRQGMAAPSHEQFQQAEDMSAELPPAKRRRTLAGSIVSTALNAALIGTAVGLTVFRLWRDRGKEQERLPPPPPYQQGGWIPVPQPTPQPQIQAIQVTPPTPRSRRFRQTPASSSKRVVLHNRRPRFGPHTYSPPPAAAPLLTPPQPEFDFPAEDETHIVEDQMDWIGDKLSMLIEEGKKALGREIVVMSDAPEDAVDDGTGVWEEEAPAGPSNAPPSRSSSIRRTIRRTRSVLPPPPSYPHSLPQHAAPSPSASVSSSPRTGRFEVPPSPRMMSRGISVDSELAAPGASFQEDPSVWESPAIRESMEKARARLLRNRAT